jgi:hypothetical protein
MPYGKKAGPTWAVATSACQKKGMKSFKKGSAGDSCRKHIAEAIAAHGLVKPRRRKK